jgi:hypothetical protein
MVEMWGLEPQTLYMQRGNGAFCPFSISGVNCAKLLMLYAVRRTGDSPFGCARKRMDSA